jgi:hypothetical protein
MASDSFTGADGTLLATHDANWAAISGFTITNAEIAGGACGPTADWGLIGARYSTSDIDASQILHKGVSNANYAKQVHVRAGASTAGYSAYAQASGANFTSVIILKNGTYATEGGAFSVAIGTDFTLKIAAAGTTTVTVTVYVDGTSVKTWDDSSSPIGAGNPGFSTRQGSGDHTQAMVDDWTDGAAAAGTPLPVFMNLQRQFRN